MTIDPNIDSHSPLTCEACKIIDRVDGKVDGQLFNLEHWGASSEHRGWDRAHRLQNRFADRITAAAGSLNFAYVHTIWFGIWIALNIGIFGASIKFDKFPFGLLTMVVSLEAIFLSTFVMVSQNRQATRSNVRSQIDFESNLQSLIWLVHIAQKIDVDIAHVDKLCEQAIVESRKSGVL